LVGKVFTEYYAGLDFKGLKDEISTINYNDFDESQIVAMKQHYAVNLGMTLIKLSVIGKGGIYVNRKDEKIAEIINNALKNLDEPFDDFLYKILSYLEYGWFSAEKIWKIENGTPILRGFIDHEQENTVIFIKKDNGFPVISKFRNFDAEIPAEKCIYIVNNSRNKNPYGQSMLEPVYKHYIASDRFQKYEAMFLERMGIPPIIMKVLGYNEFNLELAQEIIKTLHSESGVPIPDKWSIETLESQKKGDSYFRPAIVYHDTAILRGLLFPAGLIDEGKSGTYGLGDIRFEIFKWTINNIRKKIKFVLDKLFAEWCSYISPNAVEFGEWQWTPYQNIDWIQISEGIKNLVDAQIIDPTIDADFIRTEILGLKTMKDVYDENVVEGRQKMLENRKFIPSTIYRTDAMIKAEATMLEAKLKEKEFNYMKKKDKEVKNEPQLQKTNP